MCYKYVTIDDKKQLMSISCLMIPGGRSGAWWSGTKIIMQAAAIFHFSHYLVSFPND